MNAWLALQKVRVLIPLVWVSVFAAATLGNLMVIAAGASHHFYWREMLFGSCLVMLTGVTGIKGRQK